MNDNVKNWLNSSIVVNGTTIPTNVVQKYLYCLLAPNYTVFSNTSSAAEWNTYHPSQQVVPLESPHNSMHLAVGGYDVPSGPNAGDDSPISGANGDMGENDTAGLDPIFYFHHCFIDRVFWLWQTLSNNTTNLEIIDGYPGTNTVDAQGATPGFVPNSWLTLQSPLDPFKKTDGTAYKAVDMINIQQIGYNYGPVSLQTKVPHVKPPVGPQPKLPSTFIRISGINRAVIAGSFLITPYILDANGNKIYLGTEAVLSRWSTEGCMNCQTHLETKASFFLHGVKIDKHLVHVDVLTHGGLLPNNFPVTKPPTSLVAPGAVLHQVVAKLFRLDINHGKPTHLEFPPPYFRF